MGTQSADDAARELDPPWLGPKGIRWPVDWSVKKWVTFALVTLVTALAFAFVLPLTLVLGVLVGAGGRSAGRLIDPDHPRRWTLAVAVPSLGLVLLFVPLRALALPMPLLLVPFAAVASGFWFTRLYGRLLDWNRPIGFYLRMPRLVAAGPRLRPEREVDPARLILTAGPDADRRDLEPAHKIHKQFEDREKVTPQEFVDPAFDLGPHHWTGPGDEIEPGTLIRTHDRIPPGVTNTVVPIPPDSKWVETGPADPIQDEQDLLVRQYGRAVALDGRKHNVAVDVPLVADPARPRKPRWIQVVPGGVRIGNTILDFTVKGPS